MSRRKKQEAEKENSERWLLTYSDLITLLMIFFVVMYSISTVNAKKMQQVAQSLNAVFAGGKAPAILDSPGPSIIKGQSGQKTPAEPPKPQTNNQGQGQGAMTAEQKQMEAIKKMIENVAAKESGLNSKIVVIEQERGLVISLKDTLLFPDASADLTPHAKQIIYTVGQTLTGIPNQIRLEGHTDNLPIHTARFPSNWELSVLRATNVAHELINQNHISPLRISATGYGEYRPLVPNNSAANRSLNRRVDIVILKQKYDYFEPPKQLP
ncbi:MAG: flagellar motor protein MotB [Candidatus Saccharibacteria bacterium]